MPTQDFVCNDASGDLWAHARDGQSPAYRYTRTGWQPQGTSVPYSECVFMTPGPREGVYALCLDRAKSQAYVIRYTRTEATILGGVPYKQEPGRLVIEPGGAAWVLGPSRELVRIAPGGQPVSYRIPDDGIAWRNQPRNDDAVLRDVNGTVDDRGRVWFWSYSPPSASLWDASIQGFAIWNGKDIIPAGHLFGLPDGAIASVTPKDKKHFWVCVQNNGPYSVDTDALTGETVAPANESIESAARVFSDGRSWFALAWPNRVSGDRLGELWRLAPASGSATASAKPSLRWTPVVKGFQYTYAPNILTPVAATNTGTWIGAWGGGIWWLPRNGSAAVAVDWRRGYRDDVTDAFGRLPDGRIVAASSNLQWTYRAKAGILMPASPPPLLPPSEPAVETIPVGNRNDAPLRPDSRGRLWDLRFAAGATIDEWDGNRRIAHPLPKEAAQYYWPILAVDNQDRIWLFRDSGNPPTPSPSAMVLDPRAERWRTFTDPQIALQSHAADPGFAFRPECPERPLVKNGKICFYLSKYLYFDGKNWHTWSPHEALAQSLSFDGDEPAVEGSMHEWRWDGSEWRQEGPTPLTRKPERDILISRLPPEGAARNEIDSIAADGDGGIWFTSRGQLYRSLGDRITPVFAQGEANPFSMGMRIDSVVKDAEGKYWISPAYPHNGDYLRLIPRRQPGAIAVTAHQNAKDDFTTTVSGAPADSLFTWSLDGGPLIAARDSSRRWRYLLPGRHAVTVTAMSPQSLPLQNSMTVPILSTGAPQDQITRLTALLTSGSDSDREEAVKALSVYGDVAVPALKSARSTAGQNGAWWIDTALQKIAETSAHP
jgi:hypothetical protein